MAKANMTDDELLRKEARRHNSDYIYGRPLYLGHISIAMHASNCSRCAELARKAALGKRAAVVR